MGIGPDGVDYPGLVSFDAGQNVSASMIVPVDPTTGTITVTSWAATDLAIDVIGSFTRPTRTWRYHYDTSGLRIAKEQVTADGNAVEWRQEHTWTATGGLPLLLAEHQGSDTTYVIYGPGGTPIYQINATGEIIYLHQDHQGSVRLVTNANGTTRGAITYDAHGQITANTNPWILQQPLLGYTGQYHDTETGYIYLRARHYDPTTGQFTSVDPLVALTEEPYGYVYGNPANHVDPTGLWIWDGRCVDLGALPLVGQDPTCVTRSEKNGGTWGGIHSLVRDDPGLAATIAATILCVGGPAVCGVAQTIAVLVRANERRLECDENWVRNSAVDAFVTYAFFALGSLPVAGAAGKLGGSFADDAKYAYGFAEAALADLASWIGLASGVPRDE